MIRFILLALLASLAVACTPSRAPLPPTPILEPASDFVSGVSEQEPGSYLFVESWTDISGSTECERHRSIDFPTYGYQCPGTESGDCPWVWGPKIPDSSVDLLETSTLAEGFDTTELVGFHGSGTSMSGIGGGVASSLYPIKELPFSTPEGTIRAVGEDGTITVRIGGDDYYIKPTQSWVNHRYADDEWFMDFFGRWFPDEAHALTVTAVAQGCTVVITDRLTNFGILSGEQIDVGLDLGAQ